MSDEIEAAPMCFACGQDNPIGLKIHFDFDGDTCTAEFTPNENHVGFQDTVHGGIIYTALDDTAKCEVRYRQPSRVGEKLLLKGWIENERRRLIILKGEIRRAADGVLVAECDSSFMLEKD
jgi:acyl-coenzyme A thioesterase PaaI-like protein